MSYTNIEELLGKVLAKINRDGDEELIFYTADGAKYRMYHEQDCCEHVSIEDIIGDFADLIDSPIIMAEEITQDGTEEDEDVWDESATWTFYKLATNKGYVTIRWYGSSNGYYSESVVFVKEDD
jgi:hypothetical protein